ncbi:unnamed protein product [Cyclocybe aegerita]|uniref:Cytochrome P450 n=1 Tax=Cyclocybe aegerita TaxID=1973307 RepID=A0A8S0XH76_CYCAE|nr:unnamed protein product [Cyclocybe aegerita]
MLTMFNFDLSLTTFVGAAVCFGILVLHPIWSRRKSKLPPGPRRLPIIGNAHQIPAEFPWMTFSDWSRKYGDIMHVDAMGQSFVIVSSPKIAQDLLDKRSSVYSDRPHFVMANELVGYGESFVLQPYGDNWRRQRRLVAQDFAQSNTPRYYSLQEREARILVRNIMDTPSSLVSQIKLRIGMIIIRVTYGYSIRSEDDALLATSLKAVENFSILMMPGNFLVDLIPPLKYLPRWLPGTRFFKTAEEMRKILLDGAYIPYNWCKTNLETGKTLMPNLCATIIQEAGGELPPDTQEKLIWAAGSVMGGGLDTNISAALTFYLAMILNPAIQTKAQAELDNVVGKDRLPEIADRPNLPYVKAIIAEIFRSGPSLPLGIPHVVSQDDVYEGYSIPKGSVIMPNIWHMLHDPEVYPNPNEFNPDRFNGSDVEMEKVKDLVFGFGRRVCPGRYFAEATLFAIVATTLATCNVLPGHDADGKKVLPEFAYSSGAIIIPKPFTLRLRPRSEQAAALLADVPSAFE